jgi:hypothetical protein
MVVSMTGTCSWAGAVIVPEFKVVIIHGPLESNRTASTTRSIEG